MGAIARNAKIRHPNGGHVTPPKKNHAHTPAAIKQWIRKLECFGAKTNSRIEGFSHLPSITYLRLERLICW
jgi:hypothetical protein